MSSMFLTLNEYFGTNWPSFLPKWPDPEPLNHVWIEPPASTSTDDKIKLLTRLLFEEPLDVTLPGLNAVSFVLAPEGDDAIFLVELDLKPTFEIRISNIPILIKLDTNLFRPVKRISGEAPNQPDRFEIDTTIPQVEVSIDILNLKIDSTGGIDLETSGGITLPPMMIGESGIVIEAAGIVAHLKNMPVPTQYATFGLPNNWQGLLIERAQVTLPPDLVFDFGGELAFEHCAIGDGGFSGKLSYTAAPPKQATLLGTEFALNSVKLEISENILGTAVISGSLDLPIFDKPIGVTVSISSTGEFDIALDGAASAYKLRLPGITDEPIIINNPEFALHTSGDDKCMALRWTENDIKKFLSSISPALKDQSTPLPATITLRTIFGDPIAELRLEWEFEDMARTFALPGVKVTIPKNTKYCVLLGGGGRSFTHLSFILTLEANAVTQAASTFAWGRGDDRELHNDDAPASDKPLFQFNLQPDEKISLVLFDMNVAEAALPRFLQQLETDLVKLDFDAEETLCDATPFVLQSLNGTTWKNSQFILDPNAFKMPFLQQKEDNPQDTQFAQFIQIKEPSAQDIKFDFATSSITFKAELTLTFGPISFNSDITFKFNWLTFAIEVDHDSGLKLLSKEAEINPAKQHLGLKWNLKGAKAENNLYHYFTLVTKDYNYQIQMAEDAVFELQYTQASEEPIVFAISAFVLSPKGINLTAEVTDRPARLNGIDTRFRFHGSRLEVEENRIKDFTLAGSGPLPPALVGDAMVDIALQFAQRQGNLTLIAGSAQLQGNKLLDCKGTRFQFSVDAIGLKFVNDGKFHLYFTLTGSAQFVLVSGDDNEGALALLPKIKIDMVECPLTGDASVIAKHVQFLIELPKPLSFSFLKCFEFELRGFGFLPQAEVFDNDPAMMLSGQIKFAQGTGDALNAQIDFHNLYLGLPAKGEFVPRIYLRRLAVNISMGAAFELYGMVEFTNKTLMQGFEGEGSLTIQGMPKIAASFGFMRVRHDEESPWLRAWFIYLEVQRVSFRIPVIEIYLREIGLGFGYRYTITSIKAADLQNDIKKLLQELKALSKTQGDLSKIDRWAVDLEEKGEDPRWTIVLRAMISQTSGSQSPLQYIASTEESLPCVFLIDAVIAFRSDLTFFMAARAWLNTNYHEFTTGGEKVSTQPLFSGFILLSVRKKMFLMNVSSNPGAYIGDHPELPDFVKQTIKSVQFSATLLIQPGLFHFELGWPNMLRWNVEIGKILKIEYQAGFIFRITPRDLTIGISMAVRGTLDIQAELDLGLVGVRVRAFVEIAFGARLIAIVGFPPDAFACVIYGAIGLELRIELSIELWIKIPLLFTTIELTFKLSLGIGFTAGMEVAFGISPTDRGIRGTGTLSVSAMGHSLQVSVKLAINGDAVDRALDRTKDVMNLGLEATDVEGVPGVEATQPDAIRSAPIRGASPTIIPGRATRVQSLAVGRPTKIAALAADAQAEVVEFHLPSYSMFVIRKPDAGGWSYFILLPKGEKQIENGEETLDGIEPGFLPPPPLKLKLKRELLNDQLDRTNAEGIKAVFEAKDVIISQASIVVRRLGSEWTLIDRGAPQTGYLLNKALDRDVITINKLQKHDGAGNETPVPFEGFEQFILNNYTSWIKSLLDARYIFWSFRESLYEAIPESRGSQHLLLLTPLIHGERWLLTFDGATKQYLYLEYHEKPNPEAFDPEKHNPAEYQAILKGFTWYRVTAEFFHEADLDVYQSKLDIKELPDGIKATFDAVGHPLTKEDVDPPQDPIAATVTVEVIEATLSWRIIKTGASINHYLVKRIEDHYEIVLEVEQDVIVKLPESFLFNTKLEYTNALNSGELPANLKGEFESLAGIALSTQCTVTTVTADNEWQITDAESTPPLQYRIRKSDDKLTAYGGIHIEHFIPAEGWTNRSNHLLNQEAFGWQFNWDAPAFDAKQYDVATAQNAEQITNKRDVTLTLGDYLSYGYRLKDMGANPQPQVVPIGDPETDLMTNDGSVVEDERVYNPSDNAFEAAVRGAVEQFEGSPYFKRDPKVLYDQLLGEAFNDDTTIYHASGIIPKDPKNARLMQENQQAMQLRGMVIQDFVADIREYSTLSTTKQENYHADSSVFQTGMVFRFKGDTPQWLDGIVKENEPKLILRQRRNPNDKAPTEDEATAETFNIFQTDFAKNPPQFQRVQQYTDANTIAITWDLGWNITLDGATKAQRDPEHHLVHYLVRRRTLDGRERETVYTVKNAQALHRNEGSLMQRLKPRFQIVDHFTKETLDDVASLPATGRSYLYTITPVDFAGNMGRPLTLVATRYPNVPPLVPVNSEFIVTYRLADNVLAPESATAPTMPEIVTPQRIHVEWTEPTDARRGVHVPVAIYRLIFRKDPTMPIGSYGLDSATQGPRTKSLPTSNARPLPTDIKIELELDSEGPKSARKLAELTTETLQKAGIISDGIWRPESWQVFFQTESVNGVPSALAPVQLLLRVEKATPNNVVAAEERRPAELEWLAHPIQFQLLPPEDQRAEPGLAHFPMPTTSQPMLFTGDLSNISYQEHPAGIRCIRFRWNQGPSQTPDYPLDLNAGYYILQLDIDAQTDETFEDKEKLANALRSIQEVQMLPADDLLLTPGNTLTVNQWEAWYPSALKRRRSKEDMIKIRSQITRGPWYSWRESVLEWPPCPLDVDIDTPTKKEAMVKAKNTSFDRAKPFHHILQRIIDELSRPAAEDETKKPYVVDVQVTPPMQPVILKKFMANTTPKNDPYGWGVLQRFGLSIGFTLHQPDTGEVVFGDELLQAVQQALEKLNSTNQLHGYQDHLYVELLFNSGQAVSLKPQDTKVGALLAICQISLRPRTRQYLKYGALNITGAAGSPIVITFTLTNGQPCSLIIQSAPRKEQTNGISGQIELEPVGIKPIIRETKLPLNGDMTLLLRSAQLPNVQISVKPKGKTGDLSAFAEQLQYDLPNEQIIVKKPLGKLDDAQIAKLRAGLTVGDEFDEETFNTLLNLSFKGLEPFWPTSELSTYFTAPSKLLSTAFANPANVNGGEQWTTFRRYAESINGPADTDQIAIPTQLNDIETLLPEYIDWSQRFFDAAGDVVEIINQDNNPTGLLKTGAGPWVATAYPRVGSPAYATPDAAGRLKYDHLLEDKWAHNYRYYIRPYGRYDLLWQSFRQSPNLFPDEQVRKLADAIPNPADGGLDVVLDRTQPVDMPLILRSSRLDAAPKPGQPVPPGSTWEVIVAQHPEQALIERNQTLARQLAFRQVAFTLLRRFTYDKWTGQLKEALVKHDLSSQGKYVDYVIDTRFIENRTPQLPSTYPEKPDHLDLSALSENDARSLDLPERVGAFQQGALALQWEALPFYYTHKLLVIAQTASTVSNINQVEQRDFEYRSPLPSALVSSAEEIISLNNANLTTHIRRVEIPLRRFWDSLPETAQTQWSSENPDASENSGETKAWTFGGLPDSETVYQIVEVFNGNIEVQAEYYFDLNPKSGKYEVRQLGKQHFGSIVELLAPPAEEDSLEFKLITSLLQVTEEELNGEQDNDWQNGRVKIAKTGASAARLQITGVFTADDLANVRQVITDEKDQQLLINLYEGWYSQESITEVPSEESLDENLQKLVDFPYANELTLVWEGTITPEEKAALLAIPGDSEFQAALARLAAAAEKAKPGDVIKETISPDLLPFPNTGANIATHIRLDKSEDGSRYTTLTWIGGLLTDSIKTVLNASLNIWTQATGMQKEVDALMQALDDREISRDLPKPFARLSNAVLPEILRGRLNIGTDSLTWNSPAPTDAEREALKSLRSDDEFMEALKGLLAKIDTDKKTPVAGDGTFDATLPSTLKQRIVVSEQPPTLTWKGPSPTDAERAEIHSLIDRLPRSDDAVTIRRLVVAINAAQSQPMKSETQRPQQVPQLLANQLTIAATKVTWKGRIHSNDALQALEGLTGDQPFKNAIADIIKEIKEGEVSVLIDRSVLPNQDELREILRDKLMIGRALIRYHGLMTPTETQAMYKLFTLKVDQRAVLRLNSSSMNKGLRGRKLNIRSRRGSAAPSPMIALEAKPVEVGE